MGCASRASASLRSLIFFAALGAPASAGDTFTDMLELVAPEVMTPTVFEIEDVRPLWMTAEDWALRGVTDRDLVEFVAPPSVSLPGAGLLLIGGLGCMAFLKRGRP